MWWIVALSVGCCCTWFIIRSFLRKRIPIRSKTVLITGASSGLGKALARRLFEEQCRLILIARRLDRLEDLRDELLSKHPSYPRPILIQLDLSNADEISNSPALQQVLNEETIDCLINNAGISQRSSMLQTPMNIVEDIVRLNYLSLVQLTQLVLAKMVERQRRDATIVNISSMQGLIAVPDRSSYSASKHAVQAFSDALRMELQEEYPQLNIHVCVVSPSYIRTELGQQALNRLDRIDNVPDEKASSAYEPDYVANRIVQAIESRQTEMIIGPFQQHLAIWLRRFYPTAFFSMMVARNKRLKARK